MSVSQDFLSMKFLLTLEIKKYSQFLSLQFLKELSITLFLFRKN